MKIPVQYSNDYTLYVFLYDKSDKDADDLYTITVRSDNRYTLYVQDDYPKDEDDTELMSIGIITLHAVMPYDFIRKAWADSDRMKTGEKKPYWSQVSKDSLYESLKIAFPSDAWDVNEFRDPDHKDVIDITYVKSGTNIIVSPNSDKEIRYTEKKIILAEKEGSSSYKAGLLKLDKTLYEKIDKIKMSPREFMKSLASIAGDDLWSSKFMSDYTINI